MSALRNARDINQLSLITIKVTGVILEWSNELTNQIKGSDDRVKELYANLQGNIGPIVQKELEAFRKRVREEAKTSQTKDAKHYVT